MSKMRYFIFNGLFAGCLYFGLVEGVNGALNVAIFVAWSISILALFCVSDAAIEQVAKSGKTPSVPQLVDVAFDGVVVGALVWNGWIITGVAYAVHMLCGTYLREKVQEYRQQEDT